MTFELAKQLPSDDLKRLMLTGHCHERASCQHYALAQQTPPNGVTETMVGLLKMTMCRNDKNKHDVCSQIAKLLDTKWHNSISDFDKKHGEIVKPEHVGSSKSSKEQR